MMPEIEALGSIRFAALGVALLIAAAFGAGRLLVAPTQSARWTWGTAALLRVAVGLNLVAMLGVGLGLTGLLADGRSLWLLVGLSLVSLADAWRRFRVRQFGGAETLVGLAKRLPWGTTPALGLTLITLGPALCYPTGWDELMYHGVLPQRWLVEGWPAFYSDLPYSGFPLLGEILLWLIAPLEHVVAIKFLNWVCWLLGLAFLYRLLRRRVAGGSAIVLTCAFGACSTLLLISANCYVESILMMNVAAMLLAVGTPRRTAGGARQRGPAVILGVLAGGAAAVKMTGIAVLAVPCLWYIGEAWHDRSRWQIAARSLAAYVTAAFCVCLPFYLRPWMLTGNPFYPYFGEWFTDELARIEMSRFHHGIGGQPFGLRSVAAFVHGPVLLATNEKVYDGGFGWQALVFIVLAVLAIAAARRARYRAVVLWPAVVSLWLYVFWYLTTQQARFAVPAALAFVVLAGLGLQRIRGRRRRWALTLLIALAAFSAPWRTAGYYVSSWETALGLSNRTAYVDEWTDLYYLPLVEEIRGSLPRDARLMLLFEHRGFYMPRPYVIGTPIFQEEAFSPPERFAEPSRIIDELRRLRITHVVMATTLASPDQLPTDRLKPFLQAFEQCAQQDKLRLLWESERHAVLEVRSMGE